MSFFREAVVDANGQVDVANLGFYWVTVHVLGAIVFVCAMSAWSFARCEAHCTFDPQPLGVAVVAILGGYATTLAALGTYMRLVQPRLDRRDAP
jgi:hypothetical protein